MVEKRKVSFKELGLTVSPGKEVWGPRRIANQEYVKKCNEILEEESRQNPTRRVIMTVDHASRNIVFEYLPIDFELEGKMRKVNRIMEKAKLDEAKNFWKGGAKR